jgi:hypothetical protein
MAGLVVVAIGLATAGGSAPSPKPASAVMAGSSPSSRSAGAATVVPSSPSPIAVRGTPAAPATPRASPPRSSIKCHGTSLERCLQIANAAMRQLPSDAPPVETIAVGDSILCSSDADCPPSRFQGYRPLGSAVVSFGPGRPRAWLNVVEPTPFPGWVWVPADSRAWIIRWDV